MSRLTKKAEIVIYKTSKGETSIDVTLEHGTVWLSAVQMTDLFESSRQNIGQHIKRVFADGELEHDGNVLETMVRQEEGNRTIQRKIELYSLDVIISVGYRVKSRQGTTFRIWANKVLKSYLLEGYVLNEKKIKEKTEQYEALKNAVALINNVASKSALSNDEATGLFRVLTDYTYALDVLDKYDHQVLQVEATSQRQLFRITYESAKGAIFSLRDKFGGSSLFGNEKDDSFRGSLE